MTLFALRHSEEGQATLAHLLVRKYVRRGAFWLHQRAPGGWFRNCMDGAHCRVYTSDLKDCVLSLAFEYQERFADSMGYVNPGKVLRHFGLDVYTTESHRLGFEVAFGAYRPFQKYQHVVITSAMCDAAWKEFLTNPPSMWRATYRHPLAFERRFAARAFGDEQKRVRAHDARSWKQRVGYLMNVGRPRQLQRPASLNRSKL